MCASVTIKHLRRAEVDITKWDACIGQSSNGLIYAYSFYLDRMAANWDALVYGDYEIVMPIPWKKKIGFYYIYQPFLAAQLGVFGKNVSEKSVGEFINAIPLKFKMAELSFNAGNSIGPGKVFINKRLNYILDLSSDYDSLYDSYRDNAKRNVRKAAQMRLLMEKDFDVEKVIGLAVAQMRRYGEEEGANIRRFRELYKYLHQKRMATTYGIFQKGELLASSVFFFSNKRAYYILVGNHPNGKTLGASHALIDAFVKDNAGKEMLLDFEGSDIPSLGFFYSGFGAQQEIYPSITWNRLPFYIKWFKRHVR